MKFIVFIFCIINPVNAILAQSKAQHMDVPNDSVNRCIEKISWLSLVNIYTYGSRLSIDSNAQKLVEAETPGILHQLYDRLCDKEKAIVLHMILTKRLEKIKAPISPSYSLDGKLTKYEYNGAKWQFNSATQQYSISNDEVEKLKKYWRKKIYNKD